MFWSKQTIWTNAQQWDLGFIDLVASILVDLYTFWCLCILFGWLMLQKSCFQRRSVTEVHVTKYGGWEVGMHLLITMLSLGKFWFWMLLHLFDFMVLIIILSICLQHVPVYVFMSICMVSVLICAGVYSYYIGIFFLQCRFMFRSTFHS